MRVYHGSLEIVDSPEIREADRTLDYGAGFYVTSSFEQAEKWVRGKLKGRITQGYVNIYDYEPLRERILKVLHFPFPSAEWVDFVMANRMDRNFNHDYDIVRGPVANDRVYASFALYEAGLLSKSELITELKAYKLVDQILLHTPGSIPSIRFIEAREVKK